MNRRRPPLAGVLVLAALGVVAACGGSGSGEEPTVVEQGDGGAGQLENPDASTPDIVPAAGMPDPCSLVTESEVASVVDAEVASTERARRSPTSAQCSFLDDAGSPVATVAVSIEDAAEELAAVEELADTEPVDGVGDEAVWSPTVGAVAVLDGRRLVTVSLLLVDQDPDDLREPAIELAEVALTGLPPD